MSLRVIIVGGGEWKEGKSPQPIKNRQEIKEKINIKIRKIKSIKL